MKKVLLSGIVLVFVTLTASAHSILGILNVGGRIGITSSSENIPTQLGDVVEIEGLGWTGTVFARVNLPRLPFYVQPELQYTSTTITIPMVIDNSQTTEQHTYVDLPILLGAEFGLGSLVSMRFNLGPVFAVAADKGLCDVGKEDFVAAYKEPSMGWTAGVGMKVLSFIAEVRYNGNFVDDRIDASNLRGSIDPNRTSWNMSLGVMF